MEKNAFDLNHLELSNNNREQEVANRIGLLEAMIRDYQNFNRLINDISHDPIINTVILAKVDEYRINVENFNNEQLQESEVYSAQFLAQNEQAIVTLQEELQGLNSEMRKLDADVERGENDLAHTTTNLTGNLRLEIANIREELNSQLEDLQFELDLLEMEYEQHVIRYRKREDYNLQSNYR